MDGNSRKVFDVPDKELGYFQNENERLRQRVAELEALLGMNNKHQENVVTGDFVPDTCINMRLSNNSENSAEISASVDARSSNQAKIALFRTLFNVRNDVYALRYEGADGRGGYSPHCLNKWKTGLCNIKAGCQKCVNRVLAELTNDVVENHLRGKVVVGGYPMLCNETCWFLAADFDGENFLDDVTAYRKAAGNYGVSISVELSRSGNGAHAWIFFAEPILAKTARALGSGLLTSAMRDNSGIPFKSYDRLFPSQDTLTENGFGSLIALPLQKAATINGASIFVDDCFVPFEDQWRYLSAVKKHSLAEVEKALSGLFHDGGTLDADIADDISELPPWEKRNANKRVELEQIAAGKFGVVPKTIMCTLADGIYIKLDDLPPRLVNKIKLLAAFQNPEFYKRQAMRLSVNETPRVIDCSNEESGYLILPRGLLEELCGLLATCGSEMIITDRRNCGEKYTFEFTGTLHPLQEEVVWKISLHDFGVLSAGTGFGKTVVAAKMIAERGINTLILTHRKQLIDQWRSRLSEYLDIPEKEIGVIGGGRNKVTGKIDIATIQSLFRNDIVSDIVKGYGQVIVDECHHISAYSFEKVLKAANAKYVLGLTATPIRKDGQHPIITMQCGPIRYRVNRKQQEKEHRLHKQLIVRNTSFMPQNIGSILNVQELYNQIAVDESRNDLIFEDVLAALERGAYPLLLTERIEHLEYFSKRFEKFVKHLIVFRGAMGIKQIREEVSRLSALSETEERLVIATGRYIGEGFDNDMLDTLFLTMPISWRGTLQQYAGRLNRRHHNKNNVVIYDYVDANVPALMKMYRKHLDGYQQMGFVERAFEPECSNSDRLFDE